MGIRAVVVIPITTPSLKVEAVRALGGEVVLHGIIYGHADAQRESGAGSTVSVTCRRPANGNRNCP
jgi:threonine dehydratase